MQKGLFTIPSTDYHYHDYYKIKFSNSDKLDYIEKHD